MDFTENTDGFRLIHPAIDNLPRKVPIAIDWWDSIVFGIGGDGLSICPYFFGSAIFALDFLAVDIEAGEMNEELAQELLSQMTDDEVSEILSVDEENPDFLQKHQTQTGAILADQDDPENIDSEPVSTLEITLTNGKGVNVHSKAELFCSFDGKHYWTYVEALEGFVILKFGDQPIQNDQSSAED